MGKYVVKSGGTTEKITLDKFSFTANNVFIDGEGWAGPFQYDSYILVPNPLHYQKDLEIVINFKLLQSYNSSTYGGLFGAKTNWFHAPSVEIQSQDLIWAGFSYRGSTWDKGISSNYHFELNKEYWIKYKYSLDTKKFELFVSTDGQNFDLLGAVDNCEYGVQYSSAVFTIGSVNYKAGSSSHRFQYGKINLKNSYILTDKKLFWGVNHGFFEEE